MNKAIEELLKKYACTSVEEYSLALHEIIQEIALLGLWRTKFFEHAAFYGGTALRIMYNLNRFSEDLDFSLLKKDETFKLDCYFEGVKEELKAFGFSVEISKKSKTRQTAIDSAFIKANTLEHLLLIGYKGSYHKNGVIKIKFEVDKDPPPLFQTEAKTLLQPIPFSVRTFCKPSLFAGKMHALLFRKWGKRVKGRDWYDFIWYIGQRTCLDITHFNERYKQSEQVNEGLTLAQLHTELHKRIETLDIADAQSDVRPFINDPDSLELWSREFFHELVEKVVAY
jgi:predicted nucleotidyltransferase component of viral defense system